MRIRICNAEGYLRVFPCQKKMKTCKLQMLPPNEYFCSVKIISLFLFARSVFLCEFARLLKSPISFYPFKSCNFILRKICTCILKKHLEKKELQNLATRKNKHLTNFFWFPYLLHPLNKSVIFFAG